MSEKLVSILVPTYNRKWLLPRAINSLVTQSYKNIEIIVVNDGGEDVENIVKSFKDKRIKYFQIENRGLAGARNVAINNSNGDFICLLDDDDIYLKYAIEFRMHMINQLHASIVYTRSLRDIWEKRGEQYVSVAKNLYWDSPFDKDLILVQNIAPCCNILFSRKAWEKTGNYQFDETLTSTEDHDMWIGLSRYSSFHNLEIVDTECSYRTDATQMTGARDFSKNWITVFKKWRNTAKNLEWVVNAQNNVLQNAGINPADHGL
jgi:glycosyltransferase involved in cell wall biosynthesis